MAQNDDVPIIIDNGGYRIRAGFAGDEVPAVKFSPVAEELTYSYKHKLKQIFRDESDVDLDTDSESSVGTRIRRPLSKRLIINWDDMEKVWRQTFYDELKIYSDEHFVLITEPPLSPKAHREIIIQMMFNDFKVFKFYISVQPVLAVHAARRTVGVVVDLGFEVCHVTPVHEGFVINHAVIRLNFGGNDLTEYLMKLLVTESGHSFTKSTQEREIVEDIKHKLCYVAENYELELEKDFRKSNLLKNYELPDGKVISISKEQFKCPEILFNPNLIGNDSTGIHQAIYESIFRIDAEERPDLLNNIILVGGSSMFSGLPERLENEISNLVAPLETKVISPNDRENAVWIGGSIMASKEEFQESWITKQEYDEIGPEVVHRKCF